MRYAAKFGKWSLGASSRDDAARGTPKYHVCDDGPTMASLCGKTELDLVVHVPGGQVMDPANLCSECFSLARERRPVDILAALADAKNSA